MPYPGIPKEKEAKMDRCVSRIMKDGKSKDSAIAVCRTSIMSQKEKSKEEKEEDKKYETIVADKETRLVYFSSDSVKEKTLDATKEGQLLKNVEIFKAGTYRNTKFTTSALDKMVANFHYLKALEIFGHVPVRADHPSFGFFGGGGDVIDKVGGYIHDLKRVGTKLVADFRITSGQMWSKIQEGTYVNRSAEIGTYDDNEGTTYSPVLFGVAWVDIPQVEGLSPKFSYSKDNRDFELINLNAIKQMDEEKELDNETFPKEEVIVEEEKKEEEVKVEEKTEEKIELSKNIETLEFSKAFPNEFQELEAFRKAQAEFSMKERGLFFDKLVQEGKLTPAQKELEVEFSKELTEEQFNKYKAVKENATVVVKLDKEEVVTESAKEEEPTERTPDEKAEEFLKETN